MDLTVEDGVAFDLSAFAFPGKGLPRIEATLAWDRSQTPFSGRLSLRSGAEQLALESHYCGGTIELGDPTARARLVGDPTRPQLALIALLHLLGPDLGLVVVHAAGASSVDRGTALFCGRSGAGKTTALLNRPADFSVLSDEACVLRDGHSPTIWATPLTSHPARLRCGEVASGRLTHVFYLGARGSPAIEKIGGAESARLLAPCVWLPPQGSRVAMDLIVACAGLSSYKISTTAPEDLWPLVESVLPSKGGG